MASQGTLSRFRGAFLAAGVAIVVGGGWFTYRYLNQEPVEPDATPQIFSFEKDDLTGIKLDRPDLTVEFVKQGGEWSWKGKPWRPSDSMIRRVGHQTHDLVARATVADAEDLAEYGFGKNTSRITLSMGDKPPVIFEAGDPNPTAVSWYVRPIPGDTVYVVKKSAVDYWRMDEVEFRELRFAKFEADDAVAIEAVVDGRELSFKRVGPEKWQQGKPVVQRAERQEVRTMLGRTSALKTSEFVEDDPQDLAKYGLDTPKHQVTIRLDGGKNITLHVGNIAPGGDTRQERYVYRVEDDTVYRASDGFLDAFLLSDERYRDRRVLYIGADQLVSYTVHSERYEPLTVRKTPDGWRWPDDAAASGMTARRVATESSGPRAERFIDEPVEGEDYGFESSERFVEVQTQDGKTTKVVLGKQFEGEDDTGRMVGYQYLRVEGDPVVYVVTQALDGEITNLLNEYRRKLETDAEKGLLEADTDPQPVAP